jgi:hypothetical protein
VAAIAYHGKDVMNEQMTFLLELLGAAERTLSDIFQAIKDADQRAACVLGSYQGLVDMLAEHEDFPQPVRDQAMKVSALLKDIFDQKESVDE